MMGPEHAERQRNAARMQDDTDANYRVERSASFVEEPDEQPAVQQQPAPNPHALNGLERMLYVGQDEEGEEQFNDTWMRDHWHGRQGGVGDGMLQAHGSIGGGIGADLLKADRGHLFTDRLKSGPSGPAAGWDRLNQGWLGAFFGGIFGGKGRAFRNQQQASRRKAVTDAFAGGTGSMPSWVQQSRYGRRKWDQLARARR